MTDETTETTADTTTAVTSSEPSGVLDLRPPKESVRAELCRLGLEFSSADGTVACSPLSTIPARPSLSRT